MLRCLILPSFSERYAFSLSFLSLALTPGFISSSSRLYIDIIKIMKSENQVKRRFCTYTRNTRNIIGCIPLKCLYLNKLLRCNTVFFINRFFIINICYRLPHFSSCKQNLNTAVCKLKRVTVTRCDNTRHRYFCKRKQAYLNLVRFPALFFNRFDTEKN